MARLEQMTFKRVRAWAEGKDEGSEVGLAAVSWRCPFSNFLQETLGIEKACVGLRSFYTDGYGMASLRDGYDLPLWAQKTVSYIDFNVLAGLPVSREFFLHALELSRKPSGGH